MLNPEFFPTPRHLISRLLAGIKWSEIATVLEPSAGKEGIHARLPDLPG